jgi:hypothetical protein
MIAREEAKTKGASQTRLTKRCNDGVRAACLLLRFWQLPNHPAAQLELAGLILVEL